jgi:hypothetical protein
MEAPFFALTVMKEVGVSPLNILVRRFEKMMFT